MCAAPPAPAQGVVVVPTGTIQEGTVARYLCGKGYSVVGEGTKVCMEGGTWGPQENIFCALDTEG